MWSLDLRKRIASAGVERQINGVELDGDPFPALNNVKWPALDGNDVVGKVTSAIYSPRLQKNIGYCWLPKSKSGMGSTVAVDTEWGRRMALVVEMPFVDPDKRIPVA